MKATRFMRIPFFVTGYLVTEDNMEVIATWCKGHVFEDAHRPFVRVPVIRPTHQKQTEAYVGTWVIASMQRGQATFKVYTEEWLKKQFFELPEEPMVEDIPEEIPVSEHSGTANNVRTIPTQYRGPNVRATAP